MLYDYVRPFSFTLYAQSAFMVRTRARCTETDTVQYDSMRYPAIWIQRLPWTAEYQID